MKHILDYFKTTSVEYWRDANRYLEALKDNKRVKRAKKMADLKHQTDGKRRYVLRDWNGYPYALTRKEIYALQLKGIMNKHITINDLLRALYVTKWENPQQDNWSAK